MDHTQWSRSGSPIRNYQYAYVGCVAVKAFVEIKDSLAILLLRKPQQVKVASN